MRSCLKRIGRSALLVAICVAVGFALLLGAFALPTEPMREHALAAAELFEREGSYPTVRFLGGEATLDNFTDEMMLIHAGYQAPETTLLQRALNIYRPFSNEDDPADVYTSSLSSPDRAHQSNYGRYWHGYLAVLKPLLSIFTYEQLRAINAVWVAALGLAALVLLWRRGLRRYMLPFALTVLLLHPVAIANCLFYTQVYAVTMLACIAILLAGGAAVRSSATAGAAVRADGLPDQLSGSVDRSAALLRPPLRALPLPRRDGSEERPETCADGAFLLVRRLWRHVGGQVDPHGAAGRRGHGPA